MNIGTLVTRSAVLACHRQRVSLIKEAERIVETVTDQEGKK